jgi:2-succinyl-5-enolpyruvyl-6-hydroxy-3-cyclohexene-1-carboxylate synthase
MNSLTIRNIKPNVHILLINNGGGAEFYFSMGPKLLPNIDLHIAASHNKSARQWVLDNNFDYLSASNLLEFDQNINRFVNANKDKPILFEIFTNKEFDMKSFKTYRRLINQGTAVEKLGKQMESIPIVKKAIETPVGQKLKTIIKQQLKKHF